MREEAMNTDSYIRQSLELHLFFGRIMKEHALFLEAGFPCCEKSRIEEANLFRREFEDVLSDLLRIDGITVSDPALHSNELITEFTIPAERKTECPRIVWRHHRRRATICLA